MLKLFPTAKFRRDYKRCKRRGLDMQLLETVLDTLQCEEPLDAKYHDHQLSGKYNKFRIELIVSISQFYTESRAFYSPGFSVHTKEAAANNCNSPACIDSVFSRPLFL